jgi:putative transcriptional regulator
MASVQETRDRIRMRTMRASPQTAHLRWAAWILSTLCALVLSSAMMRPASAEDAKPVTAVLLVARADMPDPSFKDSVVLVMNNLGRAPAGVIINRPTKIAVSHLFPDLEGLAPLNDKLYFGGPVALTSVLFVFRADAPPEDATPVVDGVYVSTNRALLRKLLSRDKPMDGLRVFVGHSGWAPGQLEAEIARGDWTLAPVKPDEIFGARSEHPWPEPKAPDDAQRI